MDLHDATLEDALLVWERKTATLRFLDQRGGLSLVAHGLRFFRIGIEESWGPSRSVNTVRGPIDAAEGGQQWTIEMQSGDFVQFVAERLEVQRS